jgi:hypothetical protein
MAERGEFDGRARAAETLAVNDVMQVFVSLAKQRGKEAAAITPLAARMGEEIVAVTGVGLSVIEGGLVVVLDIDPEGMGGTPC